MRYYYANLENQTVGPIAESALHDLFKSGTITSETNVIPEGADTWRAYSNMLDLVSSPSNGATSPPPPLIKSTINENSSSKSTIVESITLFGDSSSISRNSKSVIAALMLNCPFFGAGQIYNGQPAKGYMLCWINFAILTFYSGGNTITHSDNVTSFVWIFVMLFTMFDAGITAQTINKGGKVGAWEWFISKKSKN